MIDATVRLHRAHVDLTARAGSFSIGNPCAEQRDHPSFAGIPFLRLLSGATRRR